MIIHVAVSGGRTSAYLAFLSQRIWSNVDFQYVFCNTGWEHPETIKFLVRLRDYLGIDLVCLEADYLPSERGTRYRKTSLEGVDMTGRPFKTYAAKYGLPNRISPSCSGKLKRRVAEAYLRDIYSSKVFGSEVFTAIGIRADEADRASKHAKRDRLLYPLIDYGVTRSDVNEFWRRQPFDLGIKDDALGNCMGCWKKSDRKLARLAITHPQAFLIGRELEDAFRAHRPDRRAADPDGITRMYRGRRETTDIVRQALAYGADRDADADGVTRECEACSGWS